MHPSRMASDPVSILRHVGSGLTFILCFATLAIAQTDVLTYHNDNLRSGQNLGERRLTPANVNATSFGKLFTLSVDGKVDAQPLYVSALSTPQGIHNAVFVATEHDTVYAFDGDTGAQLWSASLLKAGETPSDDRGCFQVSPEIGITSTPVIDPTAGPHGTLYTVAMSKDPSGAYHQRLHALDLTTGAEEFGGPEDVHATFPGNGDNSNQGTVVFDPKQYKSRPGLLEVNGVIYTSWGSHCDIRPYTGWTIGYDHLTLAQASVFNFAPNGNDAAVWSAGAGPAADYNGDLYFQTGNGTFDTTLNAGGFPSLGDYGNAFVKLNPSGGKLAVLDYWTMYNTVAESDTDEDLGSGGVLLLPDVPDAGGHLKHLGVGAGKDAHIYVFDRDNMGKFNPGSDANLYQDLPAALSGGEFGMPAWFNGTVYFGAVGDVIRAFPLTNALLPAVPTSVTPNKFGYPGATPSISANGTTDPILWAAENSPAVLHAYDATNLGVELYNSSQAPQGRDQLGTGNKFITPTIANGKVYVGTTNSVVAYGLLASPTPTTTSLTVSEASPSLGSPLTLASVVAPGEGIVAFYDGAAVIGTAAVSADGLAVLSTSALTLCSHSITAVYVGNGNFTSSTSNTIVVVVTQPLSQNLLTAVPNPLVVFAPANVGVTTLTWSAPSAGSVEVHVGSPDGPLFAAGGPSGSAATGLWAIDGMVLYLQDTTGGKLLVAENTLAVAALILHQQSSSFFATPNPIPNPSGSGLGETNIQWDLPGAGALEVHVDSPAGTLFAAGGATGSATTGPWVTNQMQFFLQGPSSGNLPGIVRDTLNVYFENESHSFRATPNPILLPVGQNLGVSTLQWNVPGATSVELHVSAPDGTLFAAGGSSGTATTGQWVSDSTTFYLQNTSAGRQLTAANTIAALVIHVQPGP
jgi:Bacterial Ig-like domain (group 3)